MNIVFVFFYNGRTNVLYNKTCRIANKLPHQKKYQSFVNKNHALTIIYLLTAHVNKKACKIR